jgi:CBS domain-containing protein
MKVKDLMSTDILCLKETTPAIQAAIYMKRNNIGCLPVCDDGGFIKGILTDRDLVIRLLSRYEQGSITHVQVGEIMSTNLVTVSPKESIHNAALLLAHHKIRRLPVTEASKLVGMLSIGDIASKPVYIDEAGDVLSAISLSDGAI